MKNSEIYKLIDRLNELTDAPPAQYDGTGRDKKPLAGFYMLAGAYGGWQLEVSSKGGGASDALNTGYVSKKELAKNIRSYIRGLSYFIDNDDYFKRAAVRALMNKDTAPHELPNYRAIKCKFLGPTNHRGQRIKFYDNNAGPNGKKESRTLPLDNEPGEHLKEYAYRILKRNGFNILGRHSDPDSITFLCDNWGEEFISVKDMEVKK